MEDNFSIDGGRRGVVSRCFKCVTIIVHFISIIIYYLSTHSDHWALDTSGLGTLGRELMAEK